MQIEHILKRDGRVVRIRRRQDRPGHRGGRSRGAPAGAACRPALAATVAEALTRDGNVCPGVETIQNHVEEALVRAGRTGARRATSCTASSTRGCARCATLVDVESAMEEYLEQRDWRVNANANQGYSLGGLILNVAGKVTANYWLSMSSRPRRARPTATATSTSTTWTCSAAIAPAGRCASC